MKRICLLLFSYNNGVPDIHVINFYSDTKIFFFLVISGLRHYFIDIRAQSSVLNWIQDLGDGAEDCTDTEQIIIYRYDYMYIFFFCAYHILIENTNVVITMGGRGF